MNRWLAAGVIALTVGLSSPVLAAHGATLVLRSGERIGGELVDMGASGITFRVNGQSRQYPTGQVAVIDFVGGGTNFPANELDQVGDGGVVTTGDQLVRGRLIDVGGRFPLRITIDLAGGGTRDYNSTDLKRIYLARPSGSGSTGTTTSGLEAATGNGIRVPANRAWTDTGLTVRRGDRITFNASGEIRLSSNGDDIATPDGSKTGRRPSGPLPQTLAGALIGRIGPANMFGIGNQTVPLTMPADGRLFLGVNDDAVGDNEGEFRVDVATVSRASSRR